ncbi:hypothetical protein BP6252_01549 [Coleophoma cylindrospora]|uniref:2EXR domain-containing protein n=1 Tax=Coleophoma cylindrospora TaxID=1849047 RepID=A0A3D8ST83_9HELO|nr:hypothetical protein BP6252_01549 [Coleophoma cylindrospora]
MALSPEGLIPTSSTPTVDFPQFCRFPFEIREQIWSWCLPAPRIIPIFTTEKTVKLHGFHKYRSFLQIWVPVPVPVPCILQITQESRRMGLQHYELALDRNWFPSPEDLRDAGDLEPMSRRNRALAFRVEQRKRVYVDFRRDLLVGQNPVPGRRSKSLLSIPDHPRHRHFPLAGLHGLETGEWLVWSTRFSVEIFKKRISHDVLSKIVLFAVMMGIPSDDVADWRVLVIKDPFVPFLEGRGVGRTNCSIDRMLGLEQRELLRALMGERELAMALNDGTLWDCAVDGKVDVEKAGVDNETSN